MLRSEVENGEAGLEGEVIVVEGGIQSEIVVILGMDTEYPLSSHRVRDEGEAHELEVVAIEASIVIDDGGLVDQIQGIVPEGGREAIAKSVLVAIPIDDRKADIVDLVVFGSCDCMGVVAD